MEEVKQQDAEALVQANAIIAKHVAAKLEEMHALSRFFAGLITAGITSLLATHFDFSGLGTHSAIWSGMIGFFVGLIVGERIALVALGALIGYFLAKTQCGGAP